MQYDWRREFSNALTRDLSTSLYVNGMQIETQTSPNLNRKNLEEMMVDVFLTSNVG
jgi:hypothetical protein